MVIVRPATLDDHPAVSDLTHQAYVESGHVSASDPYAAALTDMQARAANLFVAEVEGQIAGSVNIATPGSSMIEVAYDNELEFRMLAVHPWYQGRGIGRELVKFVLNHARQHDLSQVVITTMGSMTTAQAMYARLGFQRAPDRDWNLYTAGIVDDEQGLETFLVYVHPLN
ncbi:GNAT family N-acetyltransferase [Yaniella halotolerans]|uniref:GNAT family N-acetyltransferase n=1 Tax=Yaniella halotolerans TaxID=225453 RepID=UPI0003B63FC2|nr:GNAT family N-acetyltransferase [Yaniella halotolerans]